MMFIDTIQGHGSIRSVDNLLPQSESFTTLPFLLQANAAVVAGSWADPMGGNNATKIITNNTSSASIESQVFQTIGTSTIQTFSIFVKAGTYTTWRMTVFNSVSSIICQANYDLSAVTSTDLTGSGSIITAVPNYTGWYRCSLTYTPSLTEYNSKLFMNPQSPLVTGNDYYVFGAMLNLGSLPLRYKKK